MNHKFASTSAPKHRNPPKKDSPGFLVGCSLLKGVCLGLSFSLVKNGTIPSHFGKTPTWLLLTPLPKG